MRVLKDTVILLSCSEAWRRRRAGLHHRWNPDIHHQSVADAANNKGTAQQYMNDDDCEQEYGCEDN